MGLFDHCTPLIEVSAANPTRYEVKFIVKEPKAFTLGAKMGVTMLGDADLSLTANKNVSL